MIIKINNLKLICDQIFDHIQNDLNLDQIELDKDYYWNIPSDILYSVDSENLKPDIGQLTEDYELLEKSSDEGDTVPMMLMHLAPLLRYIGEKVGG